MEPEALKIWEHFLETFNQAERKTKRLVQPFYGTPDQVYANAETIKAADHWKKNKNSFLNQTDESDVSSKTLAVLKCDWTWNNLGFDLSSKFIIFRHARDCRETLIQTISP